MVRHGEPSVHGFPSLPPPETKVVVVAQDGEPDATHSSAAATGPATRFMSFFIPKPLFEDVDVKDPSGQGWHGLERQRTSLRPDQIVPDRVMPAKWWGLVVRHNMFAGRRLPRWSGRI